MTNLPIQRVLLLVSLLSICAVSAATQPTASLRWLTTINKSLTTDTPGEHVLFGPQTALLVGISLQNFEGPSVNGPFANLVNLIRITVEREGRAIDVRTEGSFRDPRGVGPILNARDGVDVNLTVTPTDGSSFPIGVYVITIDLGDVFDSLRWENGERWTGRAKVSEPRRLVIRNPLGVDEQTSFYRNEANYHLGLRDYPRAVAYLEPLVQLRPDDWRSLAALGEAYLSMRRYQDAAVVLERALPGWMRWADRRAVNLVPNNLARSYLALGRDADALQALRAAGLSELQAAERLDQLRGPRR
jgi:hypothetical protein